MLVGVQGICHVVDSGMNGVSMNGVSVSGVPMDGVMEEEFIVDMYSRKFKLSSLEIDSSV